MYKASTTVVADNAAFAATYAEQKNMAGMPIDINAEINQVTSGISGFAATEISRIVTLDANGDLYLAPTVLVASSTAPASGQKFTVSLDCYAL